MEKIIAKLKASPFERYEELFSSEAATFIKTNTENGKRRYYSAYFEGWRYKISKAERYLIIREFISASSVIVEPINLVDTEDQVIENLDRIIRHEDIKISSRAIKVGLNYPMLKFLQPYPFKCPNNGITNK